MMNESTFLGTGWSFPPRFTNRGVVMVSTDDDIQESLRIILSTMPGERVMQPDFGCMLKKRVFDIIDEGSLALMKDAITTAVLFFEPRVILENIEMNDEDVLSGKLLITLMYKVRSTNNRYNLVYPYYLSEATNVQT